MEQNLFHRTARDSVHKTERRSSEWLCIANFCSKVLRLLEEENVKCLKTRRPPPQTLFSYSSKMATKISVRKTSKFDTVTDKGYKMMKDEYI